MPLTVWLVAARSTATKTTYVTSGLAKGSNCCVGFNMTLSVFRQVSQLYERLLAALMISWLVSVSVWPLLLSIFPLNPTNADLTLVNLVRLDSSISFNSKHHDLIELCWGSIGVWLVSALLSRVLQDRMFPCI
eukprot:m.54492 g.54492  ORF g.54492 m.54492 type:complete len:133 (-) comp11426_c0_seq1:112-510(-)